VVTEVGYFYWTGPAAVGQVGSHCPAGRRRRLSGAGAGSADDPVWVTVGSGGGDTLAALDPGMSAQAMSPAAAPIAIDPPTHSFLGTGAGWAAGAVLFRRIATFAGAASVPAVARASMTSRGVW
jgi:hypothetical protein